MKLWFFVIFNITLRHIFPENFIGFPQVVQKKFSLGLKKIIRDPKEELLLTPWYGLATDGSSDEGDKHLPLSVRHIDKDSGLIAASLLDIPNINSSSTAQQMYDVCNEVKEAFSLDWDNCVTCSSVNKNSVIGQCNCLLQKIRGTLVALVI